MLFLSTKYGRLAMNVDIALRLINSGELNVDQMTAIAKREGQEEIWEAVLEKLDLGQRSEDELIKFGEEVDGWTIWSAIIRTGKLQRGRLIEIGKKTKGWNVWEAIMEKLNLDQMLEDELIKFGEQAGHIVVWKVVLAKLNLGQMPEEKLIHIGKLAREYSVWQTILAKLNLGQMPEEKLLEIGKDDEHFPAWEIILQSRNIKQITADQLISFGGKANSQSIWAAIVKTEKLGTDQMIKVGLKIQDEDTWREIVERWSIDQTLAQQLVQEPAIEYWCVAEAVLKVLDLSQMSADQIFEIYDKGQRDNRILFAVIKSEQLPSDQLIEIGKRVTGRYVREAISENLDFTKLTTDQLIEIGYQVNSDECWRMIEEQLA